MRAKAFPIVLAVIVGGLLGTASVASYGWRATLAAAAALVLVGLAIRAFRRGHRDAEQIFQEELGDPDPFRAQNGPRRRKRAGTDDTQDQP